MRGIFEGMPSRAPWGDRMRRRRGHLDSGKGVPRQGGHTKTYRLVKTTFGPGVARRFFDVNVLRFEIAILAAHVRGVYIDICIPIYVYSYSYSYMYIYIYI